VTVVLSPGLTRIGQASELGSGKLYHKMDFHINTGDFIIYGIKEIVEQLFFSIVPIERNRNFSINNHN